MRLGIFMTAVFAASMMAMAEAPEKITTKGGVEMVKLPGGSFNMGDADGKSDASTVHEVTLSPFYMDVTEVTQEEYVRLMEYNPSKFRGEKFPVERTRWIDAAAYCNKRSEEEGLTPVYNLETDEADFSANGYRLPTEAEWEYAAKAGADTRFYYGDNEKELEDYAWFRNNSEESTHTVATKKPNAFGIYDIYGNVAEWCNDFYKNTYYSESAAIDPTGPETGDKRVLRGGSWADRPRKIGSAIRESDNPVTADICQGYDVYGFRCVRPAADNKTE